MSASLWYFGTPMPVSGQIKRWWGTLPNPIYGKPVATVGELLTRHWQNQALGTGRAHRLLAKKALPCRAPPGRVCAAGWVSCL